MFEEGQRLTQKYGADKVYDFSLGNPYGEPPTIVLDSIKKHISSSKKGTHKYMNNAGYPEVREKIANHLNAKNNTSLSANNIIMTVGAAGGLNVVLKAILNPNEEVIVFAPYFVEYNFYIDNHGGKTVIVQPNPNTLEPNLNDFESSITKNTKALIINNPNNPTGIIYSKETLEKIRNIIEEKEKEFNSTILVISDEPYAELVYDNYTVPSILSIFNNSIIVNSFSKSLALAGERIGYIAVNDKIKEVGLLVNALTFCNRTLGFVNAPALFQHVIGDCLDIKTDVEAYKQRRDFLCDNLKRIGFEFIKPQGAFYLFPKTLISDDVEFVKTALKYNLLLVPGSGFGYSGHFRLSYCVDFEVIKNSISSFEKLAREFNIK